MQALLVLPSPHEFLVADEFSYISAKSDQDFTFNLKTNQSDERFKEQEQQEFSFVCLNHQGSLVTADKILDNDQIRPGFSLFNQAILFAAAHGDVASPLRPPLKKLFLDQQRNTSSSGSNPRGAKDGPLHNLLLKTTTLEVEVDDSKEGCKKSNSTGFSKLWRFRQDLELRSNSDGKSAFAFLNPRALAKPKKTCDVKGKNDVVIKKAKRKTTSSLSAHEKLYVMNKKRKESDKRRSFLPYKQQLMLGFFANVNGFSRNLLPF